MRVLVTRPAAQAQAWAERLRAQGLEARVVPLIGIAGPDDLGELQRAWQGLPETRMVFFVSPNAVTYFFAQRPVGAAWPVNVIAASPGPGTTQGLLDAGVPATCLVEPRADAPQFDSESLWAELATHDWAAARVLVVRGTSGRDWLAERLREAGATLDFVAAYRRVLPTPTRCEAEMIERALAEPARHLWFFSSSEAIANLAQLRPAADWSASQALATHPRIAETARRLGFGRVDEARPSVDAVVACIQSRAS